MTHVTGIVLAGGKSSRMGVDKAFVEYKGKMLIEWSLQAIRGACSQILISSNNNLLHALGYNIVADTYPGAGPMAGIAACLQQSATALNIVIACDTPFVDPQVYTALIQHATHAEIVMACDEGNRAQPLIACYNKSIEPYLHQQLTAGNYALKALSLRNGCKLLMFSSQQLSVNINTPNDLK